MKSKSLFKFHFIILLLTIKQVMYNLTLIYYFENKNKAQAKEYIEKCEDDGLDIAKIIIEIWAGVFNNVAERTITACREKREDAHFIKHLLIHHQKNLVDKLFHHAEFGKRLQRTIYCIVLCKSNIE